MPRDRDALLLETLQALLAVQAASDRLLARLKARGIVVPQEDSGVHALGPAVDSGRSEAGSGHPPSQRDRSGRRPVRI